jgi:hypothetical protein
MRFWKIQIWAKKGDGGLKSTYPNLWIVQIGIQHDHWICEDIDGVLAFYLSWEVTWATIAQCRTNNKPGSDAKYISANVSVIREICWASPGSRNVSKSSLIASAIGFCKQVNSSISEYKWGQPLNALRGSRKAQQRPWERRYSPVLR